MVDTDGERVGQINGLAVMGTRDATFGIPTKITAQTFVGKSGIMNIERETSLSGQIHNKGLLILTGFLSGMFAKTSRSRFRQASHLNRRIRLLMGTALPVPNCMCFFHRLPEYRSNRALPLPVQ